MVLALRGSSQASLREERGPDHRAWWSATAPFRQ